MFQRQTGLSIEKIQQLLADELQCLLPPCFLINEVGVVYLENTSDSFSARNILIQQLELKNRHLACIAYCFLRRRGEQTPEIKHFENNPDNEQILTIANIILTN